MISEDHLPFAGRTYVISHNTVYSGFPLSKPSPAFLSQCETKPIKRNYFEFFVDHGSRPDNANPLIATHRAYGAL